MGMSASQVRFLSLQSRKNDIGNQLMSLASKKRALAHDMKGISKHYDNALSQKTLKWSSDSGATYEHLSYDLLMRPNDINTSVPYIVSTINNEVLLNNDSILNRQGDPINVSYIDIAKMLSTFSGYDKDGNALFENDTNVSTNANGELVGGKAIKDAYYIPSDNFDFSFKNLLRYKIYEKLGIVTNEQTEKHTNILTSLFGSPEAQESEVYPIGSAYGDYYLALAKLDAYEKFFTSEHQLSTANSYNQTAQTNGTFHSSKDGYSFVSTVNGTKDTGTTFITQTSGMINFLEHVDLSNAVVKNGNDYKVVDIATAGGNTFLDKYNSSYTGDYGIVYSSQLTTSGLSHTYEIDDLLASALTNYSTTDATRQSYVNALKEGINNPDSTNSVIILRNKINDYHWDSTDTNAIKNGLTNIIVTFADLMKSCTTTTIQEDAMTKASNKTLELFKDSYTKVKIGGGKHPNKVITSAVNNAVDANAVSVTRKKFGFSFSEGFCRARTTIAVDTKTIFNTLMTYYSYYLREENANKGDLTKLEYDATFSVENDADDTTSISSTETLRKDSNNNYFKYTSADIDGYKYIIREKLATGTSSETDDDGNIVDTSTYIKNDAIVASGTSGATAYKATNESTLMGKDGTTFNIVIGNTTYSGIYGVVTEGDSDSYVLGTIDAYNAFLAGENITTRTDVIRIPDNNSGNGFNNDLEVNLNTGYQVNIKSNYQANGNGDTDYSGSKYDIRTYGKITYDKDYHKKLKENVEIAKTNINKLEDGLKYFYGSADQKMMDYYDALFLRIAEQGWVQDEHLSNTHPNNTIYLNNKLFNNDFFVTVCDQKFDKSGYDYVSKLSSNVNKIYEVHDTDAENIALSRYESDKAIISTKERRIDTQMQALETEQEAINTEMESVKKIVDQNVADTFKTFA